MIKRSGVKVQILVLHLESDYRCSKSQVSVLHLESDCRFVTKRCFKKIAPRF